MYDESKKTTKCRIKDQKLESVWESNRLQVEEAGGVYVDTKFSLPMAVEDDRILPLTLGGRCLGKLPPRPLPIGALVGAMVFMLHSTLQHVT